MGDSDIWLTPTAELLRAKSCHYENSGGTKARADGRDFEYSSQILLHSLLQSGKAGGESLEGWYWVPFSGTHCRSRLRG
jgi:hypothetical protein